MSGVKEEMYKIIAEYADKGVTVDDGTELKALDIDSLIFIKMMVDVEKKFNIKINGAMLDVAEFDKVSELIHCVQNIVEGTYS